MNISGRRLGIIILVVITIGLIGATVVYAQSQTSSKENISCSDRDVTCDYAPDFSDVNVAYLDERPIYSGHLSSVERTEDDVDSWVFTFAVEKTINGDPVGKLTVRQGGLTTGGTPLVEGQYILALDMPSDYPQRILRADRVVPQEIDGINTPADARRILGDNHALVYPSR